MATRAEKALSVTSEPPESYEHKPYANNPFDSVLFPDALDAGEQTAVQSWLAARGDVVSAEPTPDPSGFSAPAQAKIAEYQAVFDSPEYRAWKHNDSLTRIAQWKLENVDHVEAAQAIGTISKSADSTGAGKNAVASDSLLAASGIDVETFDTPGAFSLIIPVGRTHIDIEVWQPAAGGARGSGSAKGGGAGAYSKKSVALVPADWGTVIAGVVGTGGAGRAGSTGNGSSPVTGSSITSVVINGVTVDIAVGTQPSGSTGAGGTATGGDVNVTGGVGSAPKGGDAPVGGTGGDEALPGSAPGGGGGAGLNADSEDGGDGANGRVKLTFS